VMSRFLEEHDFAHEIHATPLCPFFMPWNM